MWAFESFTTCGRTGQPEGRRSALVTGKQDNRNFEHRLSDIEDSTTLVFRHVEYLGKSMLSD